MRLLIFFACLFFKNLVFTQPPSNFFSSYGGYGDEIGYSVKQTLDGQFIIAGSSSSMGNGQTDVYLMKLDSMGQVIWDKYIGGFGNDIAKSVVQLSDSGFLVTGYTSSFGAGGYDVYLLRTDKFGNVVWQRTFGGLDWDFGNELTIGSDGNIYVVGYTYSLGSGKKDGLFLKYDLSGNLITSKCFGGVENEELNAIIPTNDNFLASVGYTESLNDSLGDFYFLKLDLNGDTLFTKTFGNPGKSHLYDLIQFSNGDYILVGAETYTNLPFTQSYRGYMYANGNSFFWEGNSLTTSDDEGWRSVTKSVKGTLRTSTLRDFHKDGFGVQGSIFSNDWNGFYPNIVNEFGGTEDEHLLSHEATKDGGFICVGTTRSFNSIGWDLFVIKLDSSIVNYTSIVGLPDQTTPTFEPTIVVKDEFVQIVFDPGHLPVSLELISIEGKLVKSIDITHDRIEIEKHGLLNALYLFRFNYANSQPLVAKVLIR